MFKVGQKYKVLVEDSWGEYFKAGNIVTIDTYNSIYCTIKEDRHYFMHRIDKLVPHKPPKHNIKKYV